MTDSSLNIGGAAGAPAAVSGAAAPQPDAAASEAAAPSTTTATLTLEPPSAVTAVAPAAAEGAVQIDPADVAKLDSLVKGYLDAVTTLDVHTDAFAQKVHDIENLGDNDIRASASVSNRLLEKPVASMGQTGVSQASSVSKALVSLRRQVEDLDPAHQGDLLSPKRLLGVLPFGDKVRDYFDRYQSSQKHLDAIINSLYEGQDELRRDNADIEQEKVNLWTIMGRLRQYVYLGQKLDAQLSARIATIEASDPDRAKVLKEDLLFPVRQKVQDLLTQLAVSVQGYLALDLIRRNNVELIKGVDRATTTTVSALRTAVIVAQALGRPEAGARPDHGPQHDDGRPDRVDGQDAAPAVRRHQPAGASATVDVQKLQQAFQNIYATMDEIDTFKVKALDNMQKTINALSGEITHSQSYIDRARRQEGADTGRLDRQRRREQLVPDELIPALPNRRPPLTARP